MLATLIAALSLAAAPDITFDHILVLQQGGATRTPFRADPVQARLWEANWHEPAEGDKVGERAWTSLAPKKDEDKNEFFEDRALSGGYALATFDAPEDGVMILEAAGHSMVYVNPSPTSFEMHTGDPYEFGFVRVPVKVRKGHNALLFAAGRGRLKARLTAPPAPVFISLMDATMPDLYEGMPKHADKDAPLLGAVVVVNATEDWQRGLSVLGYGPDTPTTPPTLSPIGAIPPLSVRKVPVEMWAPDKLEGQEMKFEFALSRGVPADAGLAITPPEDSVPFALRVRKPDQTRKITFISHIDGSVQYFGFNPQAKAEVGSGKAEGKAGDAPPSDVPPPTSLILSLHGASVEAAHQAECYSMKPWAALAAPTNRREYGFDWEDWGRLDALEVLEIAKRLTKPDPARIYLTGHSMGGHGTWIIGSTYPDHFAAIAPSAGWSTFWSYGGAQHFDKPAPPHPTPIEKMFQRAMNPGDTVALAPTNLAQTGVYILHGDKDDNVPVEQARTMHKLLEGHKDLAYHEQEGAGHWWGNQCMDWPPLMDFLRGHTLPKDSQVTHIQFTTANPAVSATCHWATIVQQQVQGELSSIDITVDPTAGIRGTTKNVATLALNLSGHGLAFQSSLSLDDTVIDDLTLPEEGMLYLKRTAPTPVPADSSHPTSDIPHPTWAAASAPPPTEKSPARSGPFKHAFNNRTILVYGTQGTPAENGWMLAKARLDAETIWYRGNGGFDIMADTDYKPASYPHRSVILYGNDSINAAWPLLLKDSPLEVHRGGIFIGEHEFKDDWFGALFVRPKSEVGSGKSEPTPSPTPTSDFPLPTSLVGAVAFTGLRGARALERLAYFSSGVAYPDWTIFSARTLTDGMPGVEAAGYFGNSWELDEGQSAWLVP